MWLYLLKRLRLMIPMLIGITLISFTVIHLAPGTPVEMQTTMNPKASLEAQKRLREIYGLDKPLQVQYWDWLKRVAVLDFGRSFSPDRRPVWDKIKERIGITLGLNLLSLLIILAVAMPLGVLAAYRPNSWFDKGTTLFVFFGFAMPSFWLALLLILFFGVYLDWLPISGLTSLNFCQFSFWQKLQDSGGPRHPAGAGGRLHGPGRHVPLHAGQHAGGDPPGLHHHRPGQGAAGEHGHLQTRPAKRPAAGDHHPGVERAGPHRRQRHLRDHLRHSRHGAVVLRRR